MPDNFFYHYQTLITGAGAIGAAFLAGWPVWRQLGMMRAQSEAMLRDIIVERLKENDTRIQAYSRIVSEPITRARADLYHFEERDQLPGEEWAFALDQALTGMVADFEFWAFSHHDVEIIEDAKNHLTKCLKILTKKLNEIHWTAHNDQHDENHNISDEEWKHLLIRSEEAKTEVSSDSSRVTRAASRLESAYLFNRRSLNIRLREIDDSLLGIKRKSALWGKLRDLKRRKARRIKA